MIIWRFYVKYGLLSFEQYYIMSNRSFIDVKLVSDEYRKLLNLIPVRPNTNKTLTFKKMITRQGSIRNKFGLPISPEYENMIASARGSSSRNTGPKTFRSSQSSKTLTNMASMHEKQAQQLPKVIRSPRQRKSKLASLPL